MPDLIAGLAQESISGIALGCIYALVALGFTLIYKATEVVNFAQGDIMMVGAYVNFYLVNTLMGSQSDPSLWIYGLALLGSLVFAILFGWILDFIINRPLKDAPVFSVIMATISLSIILRALVAIIAGPISQVVPTPFHNHVISVGSVAVTTLDLFIIIIALLLVGVFYGFFNWTKWGIAMQATSEDPVTAQLMGIPVKKVYRMVWIFATVVATISGLLLAPRMTLLDTNLGYIGLKAFPAAVLGGFGSIPGAIAGGIIMGMVETISSGTLSFHFQWIKEINDIIIWLVLIVILMIRPNGLFGVGKVKKV